MSETIQWIVQFLRDNPSILLFGSLAGGYAIGKLKFGTFSLGSTTSVLLVSIVIGAVLLSGQGKNDPSYHLGLIKTIAFGLFIFAIGYKVGPDFVGGLKRGGMKYVTIAVFFCLIALGIAVMLAKLFSLNSGYAGGMVAGALTQSSVIGTADNALQQLTSGKVTSALDLKSDVAVAYAVTYIFGTAGLIILLKILPRIWKINIADSAKQAEAELGAITAPDTIEAFHWSNIVTPRAYTIENENIIGKTVSQVEAMFPERITIDVIKRGEQIIEDVTPETKLDKGDIVAITSFRRRLVSLNEKIGPEVDDAIVRKMVGEILGICLTNKKLDGLTLHEIFVEHGEGCYLQRVTRQGHDLPVSPGLKAYRGDIIHVVGARKDVERMIGTIGYPERETKVTDLVTVGVGIIVGTIIGLLAVTIKGIPVTMGVGGGVLVSGLFFGWLRSVRPTWGQIPTPALWIFTDLGLNLFIACVGISAGPQAFEAIKQAGVNIFLAGICLTCLPHIITWIFGLYVLRLNPALLLGAMTGAGTCTAALNTVMDDAKSSTPVIGYTVPYAIGNVMLTIWGALIVSLV